jgi:phosphatidylserine/phosphatidylglycerophosphate/cardiolipin synthase-like enzyme
MYILVGFDDPGKERVRKALVEEIMRDLRTGLEVDRRQAVQELVKKMEGGEFRIIDARAKDHHSKLFMIDSTVALVASSNVSQRCMIDAIEAGTVVDDPETVQVFLSQFDHHFFLS